MTALPCKFRDLADEAYRYDPQTGATKRIELWLCTWPTTINAMPGWLRSKIGGGLAIDPEPDCVDCPVRQDK